MEHSFGRKAVWAFLSLVFVSWTVKGVLALFSQDISKTEKLVYWFPLGIAYLVLSALAAYKNGQKDRWDAEKGVLMKRIEEQNLEIVQLAEKLRRVQPSGWIPQPKAEPDQLRQGTLH